MQNTSTKIILSQEEVSNITKALSQGRLSTYNSNSNTDPIFPIELYSWNANISGAFLVPLQVCEVVLRNAVSEALCDAYGSNWPWSTNFEISLPGGAGTSHFKPKDELIRARNKTRQRKTGKVIPELPFKFWIHLLTSRYDQRLWEKLLFKCFPNLPMVYSVSGGRNFIHQEIDKIRIFRNRIAHHEPIIKAPHAAHMTTIESVVRFRCNHTGKWLSQIEIVSNLIPLRP